MDFLLFYDYAPDYMSRRDAYRNDHLKLAWDYQGRGLLVLAGALANPPDGGVFHFRADSAAAVEAFARADPYVRNGIVTAWRVREWTTVVGDAARTPVRPT